MGNATLDLRVLACTQRHGAHFMDTDGPKGPTVFRCKHCDVENSSNEFAQSGVNWWNQIPKVKALKNGRTIFEKEGAGKEEVQHALCLVGYRADAGK